MDVRWDGATMGLDDMINEGVRRAYNLPENVLRASILAFPWAQLLVLESGSEAFESRNPGHS